MTETFVLILLLWTSGLEIMVIPSMNFYVSCAQYRVLCKTLTKSYLSNEKKQQQQK